MRPWAFLMSTERSLKEFEQEERLAALSEKIADGEATVVMEESPNGPTGPPR